jgi:DivIVA domain-containing protein
MSFTAEDVNRLEFANAPIGRRGYAKHEVDQFVQRIARTLEGKDDLTPAEVHHVMFGKPLLGRRGYDEREVDEFLDAVEDHLAERFGHAPPLPEARQESQAIEARGAGRDAVDQGRGV